MTDDLRVEMRLRNNVLWHAIFDVYPSVAAFGRALGYDDAGRFGEIGGYLNLTRAPYGKFGPLLMARKISEFTGIGIGELFPPHLYVGIATRAAIEMPSEHFLPLAAAKRLAIAPAQFDAVNALELKEQIQAALESLTPTERKVIVQRFGLDGGDVRTCDEIGLNFFHPVTAGRIHQIEMKALRKLRHPSRSRALKQYLPDYATAPPATRRTENERTETANPTETPHRRGFVLMPTFEKWVAVIEKFAPLSFKNRGNNVVYFDVDEDHPVGLSSWGWVDGEWKPKGFYVRADVVPSEPVTP